MRKDVWKTPNGGDYSIVYFLGSGGRTVDESVATGCLCIEYDKNGKEIHRLRLGYAQKKEKK